MKGKLAIISNNERQFSETFIHQQIERLPFELIAYSSGYLPTKISLDRGKSFNRIKASWKSNNGEKNFERSLIKNKVNCVLANYGPAGVEIMHVCKRLDIPLIVHFHGFDAFRTDALQSYGRQYGELFEISSYVVVVSREMYQQLLQLGCPERKLKYAPCGVDTEFFQRTENKVNRQSIVSCGRFVAKKAPDQVLLSFKQLTKLIPEVTLTMIGDGELLETCKELAATLEITDQVHFAGICSAKEVRQIMQEAAVFIQPSVKTNDKDAEGTPLSLMEAASMQLGIVATKHGGIPDVVIHDKSGILVDEGDVLGLTQGVSRLLQNSELRQQLGDSAREIILEKYKIQRYHDDLTELIRFCLVQKQS